MIDNYKDKMLCMFFVLSIIAVLAGCQDDEKKVPKVLEGMEVDKGKSEDGVNVIKENMIKNIILSYGEEKNIAHKQTVLGDLDNDGLLEYIGVYGNKDSIEALLIMNVQGEEVIPIEWIKLDDDYIYDDLKLISLGDSHKKYLHIRISNGFFYSGMLIYEMKTKWLERVFYEVDQSGKVGYYLMDEEGDGIYEHILSVRRIEDFQSHELETKHVWSGSEFISGETQVRYQNSERKFIQPEIPIDVIKTYVDALYIDTITDMKSEIHALVENEDEIRYNLIDRYIDTKLIKEVRVNPLSSMFEFELIEMLGNWSIVQVTYDDQQYFFTLQLDQGWTIINVYSEFEEAYNTIHYYTLDYLESNEEKPYIIYFAKNIESEERGLFQNIEIYRNNKEEKKVFDLNDLGIDMYGTLLEGGEVYKSIYSEDQELEFIVCTSVDRDEVIQYFIISFVEELPELAYSGLMEELKLENKELYDKIQIVEEAK